MMLGAPKTSNISDWVVTPLVILVFAIPGVRLLPCVRDSFWQPVLKTVKHANSKTKLVVFIFLVSIEYTKHAPFLRPLHRIR